MWTPFLKTTPARISCAVCFNSYWNSGFTGQVWTEGLHIKNCGGQGCIYTRSDTRSIRGQYEVSLYGLSRSSPWASEARLLHLSWQQQRRRKQQQQEAAAGAGGSSSKQQPQAATSMCPLERMTKYKYKFEKSWQKWLSGQHLYTIVSIGIPMEVAARFKRATFKLSCKTQAKRKKYRLTPIAFPHGNEPFNCKQNRFPHPPVGIIGIKIDTSLLGDLAGILPVTLGTSNS